MLIKIVGQHLIQPEAMSLVWFGRDIPAMADDSKARRKAEREQRLQSALRDNLRRRKAQARGRAAESPGQREQEACARDSGSGAQKND